MQFLLVLKIFFVLCGAKVAYTMDDPGLSVEEKQKLKDFRYSSHCIKGIGLARTFLAAHPDSRIARTQIFAWSLEAHALADRGHPRDMLMLMPGVVNMILTPFAQMIIYPLAKLMTRSLS